MPCQYSPLQNLSMRSGCTPSLPYNALCVLWEKWVISRSESIQMTALQHVEFRSLNRKIQCPFNGMNVTEGWISFFSCCQASNIYQKRYNERVTGQLKFYTIFVRRYYRQFIIIIIIIDVWNIVTWIYDIQNFVLQNAGNEFTYRFIPNITY